MAKSPIQCWTLVLVALEVGFIITEVQNIAVFIVYLLICLFMVYLTTMSVALFM